MEVMQGKGEENRVLNRLEQSICALPTGRERNPCRRSAKELSDAKKRKCALIAIDGRT